MGLASLLLPCGQKIVTISPPALVVPPQTSSTTGMASDTVFLSEDLVAHDAAFHLTARGYINHKIGQRNLCLLALTAMVPNKTLYILPTAIRPL